MMRLPDSAIALALALLALLRGIDAMRLAGNHNQTRLRD
jgi:hypothetical protein